MATSSRDFRADLRIQLDFLAASIARFDAGHEHEALRLATTLRVLLSSQGGTPLLEELRLRNSLEWFSFAGPVDASNLAPLNGLAVPRTGMVDGVAQPSFESKATAPHSPAAHRWIPFDEWWQDAVIHDPAASKSFSRTDLVSMLANRDGGAHVGRLKPDEQRLSRSDFTPYSYSVNDGDPSAFDRSPAPASVRTIAEELLITLRESKPSV